MIDRNLKKCLALVLSFAMIITAISTGIVSADGYIGTAEDGYTGSGDILDATPNTQFKNFDFEDGLNYFQKGVAGEYASVVTEADGNKALKLSCNKDVNGWKRFVTSYPITIKNAVVGSEIAVRYDVKVENFQSGGTNNCEMQIKEKDSSLTLGGGHQYRCNINANTDGYVTYSGRWKVSAVEEGKTEFTLYFYPNVGGVTADVYIDNISIGYQPDTTYVYSNNGKGVHYPSVTEGGETLSAKTQSGFILYDLSKSGYYGGYNSSTGFNVTSDTLINGDFSKGFTGWGAYDSYNSVPVFPSDFAEVGDFDSDGKKECHISYTSGARKGLLSTVFPLTGLKTGDVVMLYFEYKWGTADKNTTNSQIRGEINSKTSGEIKQSNGGAHTTAQFVSATESSGVYGTHKALADGWYAATSTSTTATLQVDNPNAIIAFYVNAGYATDFYIRNVKIIVGKNYSATSTKYSYEYYGADNDGKYYENDGITEKASPYGTSANGITTEANASTYPNSILYKSSIDPVASLNSGSLFCWGPTQQDNSNLEVHNGAEAITFNDDGSFNLKWIAKSNMGISSTYFALPESIVNAYEGKDAVKYAIWFNYTNTRTEVETSNGNNNSLAIFLANGETTNTYAQNANKVVLSGTAVTKNNVANLAQISFKIWSNYYQYKISDFTLGYVDLGGMEKELYVYQDGRPRDAEMGDANADGEIDIRDLVRMKKRAADANQAIYLAAADMNGDGTVTVEEISLLRKALL